MQLSVLLLSWVPSGSWEAFEPLFWLTRALIEHWFNGEHCVFCEAFITWKHIKIGENAFYMLSRRGNWWWKIYDFDYVSETRKARHKTDLIFGKQITTPQISPMLQWNQ